MENKIQELTNKLYQEGVEKGEAEANRLIEEAQNKRKVLMDDAQSEVERMMDKATKEVAELKKNTESELKLYAGQSVEALKSEIANMLTERLATEAVASAFEEKDFMSKLILKLISEWPKEENLVIGVEDTDSLKNYFINHAKELLDKGVSIEQVNGKKTSFSIAPVNGGYKINFGENEFVEYFKEFLRPQLIELLF